MRIAQVAPLIESVPPTTYGGTERVVSFLTEELIRQGHDVTLFASGDSRTRAKLIPCCAQALRADPECRDPLALHLIEAEEVARLADSFDVIHYHADYLHFPTASRVSTPHLTTLHGRLDLPQLPTIHQTFPGMPLVSISDAQRSPLPAANWRATIYHGLPGQEANPIAPKGSYLAFLGRISPEKRADRAIEIAIRANQRLIIAAKVDRADEVYFRDVVQPMLSHPLVTFIGEVNEPQKRELLRDASALLFPIDWPEPFGLVMIEAMAHGVPVVAFRSGSVPEIVTPGVTGFIVDNMDQAIEAVLNLGSIDRKGCHREFLRRFTVSRMAREYVAEYERLIRAQEPEDLAVSMVF